MINTFQIHAQETVQVNGLIEFLQLGDKFQLDHDLPTEFCSPIDLTISQVVGGSEVKIEDEIKVSFDLNDDYRRMFQEANKVPNKKYPLYRALKKFNKLKGETSVVDCTAGFLGDSLLMLILFPQIHITAFEFNPLLFILLSHSLSKSTYNQLNKLKLKFGSSLDYLQHTPARTDEIYYCDPMFEVKSQKSKNKKKIQFLEALIDERNQGDFLPLLKGKSFIFKTSTLSQFNEEENPIHFKEVGKNITYYIFIAN